MRIFGKELKLISVFCYPLMLLSVVLFVLGVLSFFDIEAVDSITIMNRARGFLLTAGFCGFLCYTYTDSGLKALIVSVSAGISCMVYYAITGYCYGVLVAALLAIVLAYIAINTDITPLAVASAIISIVVALLLSVLNSPIEFVTKELCGVLSDRPSLAAVVSNITSVLFGDMFGDMYYHTDFSGAVFVDGSAVTGAIDIFSANNNYTPVLSYLTGKYIVNIFVTMGLSLALYPKLSGAKRYCLIFAAVVSVLIGDNSALSIFVFIYNPYLYVGYLGLVLVSYFTPILVRLGIGYINSGSIVELFMYGNKWIYFAVIGVVISILSYYLSQLVLSRFDFDSQRRYPREVKRLIKALGGDENIQCINHGRLYVDNPNLIDILSIDCEIHGNEITLIKNDIDLLQDYF
ncbi:MAG: hypothetical protein ACI4IN_02580 [Eubacterium sp.]